VSKELIALAINFFNHARTRNGYCKARIVLKKLIASAKEFERQKLGEILINEDAKGNIFKIAKHMVKKNKDVVSAG